MYTFFDDLNCFVIHMETRPPLPDEIIYFKNIDNEVSVGKFKKRVCSVLNRKVGNTKLYSEGAELQDDNTLSDYRMADTDMVSIRHTACTASKNKLSYWKTALL